MHLNHDLCPKNTHQTNHNPGWGNETVEYVYKSKAYTFLNFENNQIPFTYIKIILHWYDINDILL